jgi:hypothetical protein
MFTDFSNQYFPSGERIGETPVIPNSRHMKVDETPVEPEVDPPTLVTGHTGTLPYQTILSLCPETNDRQGMEELLRA